MSLAPPTETRLLSLMRRGAECAPPWALAAGRWVNRNLPGHRVRWGNLRRMAPFSDLYGWDRGLPVDRCYIEAFLAAHADRIRGTVLEIKEDRYASRFGSPTRVVVADREASGQGVELVVDLNLPDSLPVAGFDTVLLTQVLQYLDLDTAIPNLAQSLRPGGALIVTVPAMARLDYGYADRWRWAPLGLRDTLERGGHLEVTHAQTFGNHLTCLAAILGLSAQDLSPAEISPADPRFPLIVAAVGRRAG